MIKIKNYLNIKLILFFFSFYHAGVYANNQPLIPELKNESAEINLEEGKPIKIVEFFSYDCLPCYEMTPLIEGLVKKYSNNVSLQRVPFTTLDTFNASKAFYTFNVWKDFKSIYNNKIHNDLYKQVLFEDNDKIFDYKDTAKNKYQTSNIIYNIEDFLKELNLDFIIYKRIFTGPYSENMAINSISLRSKYNIDHIPIYIINDKYIFSPKINGSYENMITTMETHIKNEVN